jgi:hypothetical protein
VFKRGRHARGVQRRARRLPWRGVRGRGPLAPLYRHGPSRCRSRETADACCEHGLGCDRHARARLSGSWRNRAWMAGVTLASSLVLRPRGSTRSVDRPQATRGRLCDVRPVPAAGPCRAPARRGSLLVSFILCARGFTVRRDAGNAASGVPASRARRPRSAARGKFIDRAPVIGPEAVPKNLRATSRLLWPCCGLSSRATNDGSVVAIRINDLIVGRSCAARSSGATMPPERPAEYGRDPAGHDTSSRLARARRDPRGVPIACAA